MIKSSIRVVYLGLFSIKDMYTSILLFMSLLLLCLMPSNSYSGTLTVGGTGASLGTMQYMADAYMKQYPNDIVVVLPSLGSGGGIKAVIKGVVGLSFSGRPLKEKEVKIGLKQYPYAKSPFVVVVNEINPISNVSFKQLADIYSGKTTEWPNKQHIKIVMRDERESDTEFLRSISPEVKLAVNIGLKRKGMLFAVTDQESVKLLQDFDGSIGTSTLTQIISEKLKLKALSLEGIKPTTSNVLNTSYPYFKEFRIITPEAPSNAARRFIEFIFSDHGEKILQENGCLLAGRTEP